MKKWNTSPERPADTLLLRVVLVTMMVFLPPFIAVAQAAMPQRDSGVVHLGPGKQKQSGIELISPGISTLTPETQAYGRVVDINPLLKLYSACAQAGAERNAARATLVASQKALTRLKKLHAEAGNISARRLQEAEAAYQVDRGHLQTAEVKLQSAREELTQRWGGALAKLLLDTHSFDLADYVDQQRSLVLITLAPNQVLPDGTRQIRINLNDDRSGALSAGLVAPAPYTAGVFQGETYFFTTRSPRLRVGMRLYAWVPKPGKPVRGVMLPGSAIVWSDGKPWIYVQHSSGEFVRHELHNPVDLKTHWFVPDPSLAGARVVSTGAQMLLSEEYQRQIPDEDDEP